jgi:hypothetical protein
MIQLLAVLGPLLKSVIAGVGSKVLGGVVQGAGKAALGSVLKGAVGQAANVASAAPAVTSSATSGGIGSAISGAMGNIGSFIKNFAQGYGDPSARSGVGQWTGGIAKRILSEEPQRAPITAEKGGLQLTKLTYDKSGNPIPTYSGDKKDQFTKFQEAIKGFSTNRDEKSKQKLAKLLAGTNPE